MHVCSVPNCPVISPDNRCPQHRREAEQTRGSRQSRGYNYKHERARAQWAPIVMRGGVLCRRCQQPLDPDQPFDLGHDDTDRTLPAAPEHTTCNRATAGRA